VTFLVPIDISYMSTICEQVTS